MHRGLIKIDRLTDAERLVLKVSSHHVELGLEGADLLLHPFPILLVPLKLFIQGYYL